jgi:hypothetical protein
LHSRRHDQHSGRYGMRVAKPLAMSNDRLTKAAGVSADCNHPEIEYLGENRGAKFLRCEVCSKAYVIQEGRVWAIPIVVRSREH